MKQCLCQMWHKGWVCINQYYYHVLWCLSDNQQCQAHTNASQILWQHFQKQHTPNEMADLLCTSMDHWINCHCIELPQWQLTNKLILLTLTKAFNSQKHIGWDQFFCGWLSKDWMTAIEIYYHEWCPSPAFTSDQWMRMTINAIWTYSMTLWWQRCVSYHGINGILTLEWKQKIQHSEQLRYINKP